MRGGVRGLRGLDPIQTLLAAKQLNTGKRHAEMLKHSKVLIIGAGPAGYTGVATRMGLAASDLPAASAAE